MKKLIALLLLLSFLCYYSLALKQVKPPVPPAPVSAADKKEQEDAIAAEKASGPYCNKIDCWCGRKTDYVPAMRYCPIPAVNKCFSVYGHCVRVGTLCWWRYTNYLTGCLSDAW
jgi:hypothetical protein